MNVTLTHPVSNFTGNVTILETVTVGFTNGTATVDITEQAVEAFRELYGASAVVAGTPGPAPAFDANLDASVNKIVGNSTSTSSATLKAAYGAADPVLSNFSYDPATGNLLSYQENGVTITLTYNSDGTVATSQRGSNPAKTYSYSGGNLVGVA